METSKNAQEFQKRIRYEVKNNTELSKRVRNKIMTDRYKSANNTREKRKGEENVRGN